jgi:Kdo2-lipid IVA lauroyltransferase/acyltransferase
MAKPPPPFLIKWAQYLGARCAAGLLCTADIDAAFHGASFWGRVGVKLSRKRRERVMTNLTTAYPNASRQWCEKICTASFEHFARLIVEVTQFPHLLNTDSWSKHLTFHHNSETIRWLNKGNPALLVTGHIGNWEVLGFGSALMGYPIEALARPIDNPLINDWLMGIRERRGLKILTKWNATDRMIQVLNSGGSLGLVADQNAGDKGLFVPFFNRLASTYKSIALLAINQEVPIICTSAQRVGNQFKYQIGTTDIIKPEDWVDQPDPLFYVTARYMRALETMVRACPDQYLWMHRRWKSRPRFERLGKPMPSAMIAKIEQLPWMTPTLLEELKKPFADGA